MTRIKHYRSYAVPSWPPICGFGPGSWLYQNSWKPLWQGQTPGRTCLSYNGWECTYHKLGISSTYDGVHCAGTLKLVAVLNAKWDAGLYQGQSMTGRALLSSSNRRMLTVSLVSARHWHHFVDLSRGAFRLEAFESGIGEPGQQHLFTGFTNCGRPCFYREWYNSAQWSPRSVFDWSWRWPAPWDANLWFFCARLPNKIQVC